MNSKKFILVVSLVLPLIVSVNTPVSADFINPVDVLAPDPLVSDTVTGTGSTPRLANGFALDQDYLVGSSVTVTWWGGNAFDPTGTTGTPSPLDFRVRIYAGGSIFSPTSMPTTLLQQHFANNLSPSGSVSVVPGNPNQSSSYNEYRTSFALNQDLLDGSAIWLEIVDQSFSTNDANRTTFHWIAGTRDERDVRLATRNGDVGNSWSILTPIHLGRAFTFAAIPEPTSLSLMGLFGLGMAGRRIRRSRNQQT